MISETFRLIAIPIVVAFVTTVAVEGLAKPRLEARKARLIRDRQQFDEVVFGFQRLGMLLGALTPEANDPLRAMIRTEQLRQLRPAVQSVIDALGRLPLGFVKRHGEHIRMTSAFLGYMIGRFTVSESGTPLTSVERDQLADDLSYLDAYFLANVEFRDSQEPWIKRAFWKGFTRGTYRTDALAVLERYGFPKESWVRSKD